MTAYNEAFYEQIGPQAARSAERIVPLVMDLVHPKSVVDIGCGTGGFLRAFKQHGVEDVLGLVDLKHAAARRAGGYSLGMRQRLGLAAALLGDPELLVLDEPANGLDPEGVRWLRDFLRRFAAEGKTVFVSSHHLAEVEHRAERLGAAGAAHGAHRRRVTRSRAASSG